MKSKPIHGFVLAAFVGAMIALAMGYGLYAISESNETIPLWGPLVIVGMIITFIAGIALCFYGIQRALRRRARIRAALSRT